MTPDSTFWLATREGAVRSPDGGKTWIHVLGGLASKHVLSVKYDPILKRLLATAMESRSVYESVDGGKTWTKSPDATFSIRTAMGYQDQMLAISWHNGLLLERSRDHGGTAGHSSGSNESSPAVANQKRSVSAGGPAGPPVFLWRTSIWRAMPNRENRRDTPAISGIAQSGVDPKLRRLCYWASTSG